MDHHSKLLISLKSNGPASAPEISDVIIGWKNTFSFYWYHQFINDDQKKLDFVFNLLFELTEFPDSNVTIASFNAIGALLVSLSPFRSQELILSFKNTLSSLEVSPNTSCAVIATFVFLSHHVSDNSISHFIESTPIFPHFGADLRMFIHHIPNLIEQMDRLNMEFHQALLRSLISSFGRSPVSSFIESIMLLIKRFPNKLLSDLMEFIESNKLEATLLSVGGPILNDQTFSELLSVHQKYTFLITLKKKLFIPKSESNEAETTFTFNESDYDLQTEVTATELEQAVSIICGLKKQTEEELRNHAKTISTTIWNQRSKLKSVFQRILYPFANNIEELRPTKEDSSNEMSRKIMALGYLETASDDDIISICEPFIESRDECFISVLTFLSKSMKERCHKLFEKLFEKDDYSWVQRVAILNLIDNMDQFKMETYMVNYYQKTIDFLIQCALSLQTELSSQSRQVISRFVSLNNVEFFRESILKCDFFNFQITKNILMLLNVIVNSISPSPLNCFIGIVLELFDFTLSDIINSESDDSAIENINIYPSFVADCFEFLSHYPGLFIYRKSIERICMCKMQEVYYSFTQEKLFFQSMLENSSQNSSSINEAVLPPSQATSMMHSNRKKQQAASQMTKMLKNNVRPILSTITTDVVADASLVRYDFLKPLKNCLQYLVSNQMQSASYRSVFLKLLPIFPMEILPYFYDQSSIISNCMEIQRKNFLSQEEIEAIRPKILRIFESNRDQIVIHRCCEFFYQSNIITQQILIQMKNIFENTKIKSSASAFVFFKLIYSVEPENALDYLKKLLNVNQQEKSGENKMSLPDLTKNELALLASNITPVYKILSEMEEFSFLQFKTNRFSAKNWFEKNDFTTWPLIDLDLNEEIKKMFDKSYSVRVNDCSLIDNQHWVFLMKNRTLFFRDTIRSYLDSNKYLLKSICIFNSVNDEKNHFEFTEKIKNEIVQSLDKFARVLPTTALLVKKEKFVKNEILVKNFLRFSKIVISDDLLNKMKNEFPDLSSNFNEYKNRINKIKIKNEKFNKNDVIKEPQLISSKEEENDKLIVGEKDVENNDEKQTEIKEVNLQKSDEKNQQQNEENLNKQDDDNQTKLEEQKEENQEKTEEKNQQQNEEPIEKIQNNSEEPKEEKHDEQPQQQNENDIHNSEENQQSHDETNQDQIEGENQPPKPEEQKEENQVKPEESIQINNQQEENQQQEPEEHNKEEENKEDDSNKQQEENTTKSEEQKEEDIQLDNQNKENQQPKPEELKEEENLPKQEEHKEDNSNKQEEENTTKSEEQKDENSNKPEEPKEENIQPNNQQENQQPNIEERKEEDKTQPTPIENHNETQTHPPENKTQNEYQQTNSIPKPTPTNSIPDFDPNFHINSNFLMTLCIHPPKTPLAITMYRMHLINRIDEIKSPTQFFYFIRFLRINLVIPKNSRESLAIKKNTIENFGPIATRFVEIATGQVKLGPNDSDFDYFEEEKDLSFILLEFVKLSSKLFTIQDLHRVIRKVSVPVKTDSIELLLISNLVIHSSKFKNIKNNVFNISNNLLTNYSIHQLKSSLLPRVPSFLSFIITTMKMLPDEESSMFFTRHYKTLLDDEIVSDFSIEFLSFYMQNQGNSTKNYYEYFDVNTITQILHQLFDTRKSNFKKSGEKNLIQTLLTLMKGQYKNNLLQFQPLIEKLSVCGYSLPFAIDIVTSYFSTVAFNLFNIPVTSSQRKMIEELEKKEKQNKKTKQKNLMTEEMKRQNINNFQKDFGIKEIRIVQSIFQVCPSILNAMKFGKILIKASSFFDSLALIFGNLAPFEDSSFVGIFCIASMFYFEFINDFDKKKKFNELVNNFEEQGSTFKSRSKSLQMIINSNKNNFNAAFAVSCLETNDQDKIEEVINLFND